MINFVCCWILGQDKDNDGNNKQNNNEESRLSFLRHTAEDIKYRSHLRQLPSLQHDGTERKVMETLKALVKENHYTVAAVGTACVGTNVWLYTIPTPKGSVSINPDTHFQCHRVLRIYLGTEADWKTFRQQLTSDDMGVSFSLEDTAFEEKE
jgi:hypothetical protein